MNSTAKKRPGPPRREFCQRGHSMEGANVGVSPSGGRCCVACHRLAERAYRQRKKARGAA